jgi:hypothetical protein
MGQSMYQENFRIRDKVDELRTSGFLSKVITPLDAPNNSNNGVDSELILKFTNHHTKIKHIVNGFGQ